MRYGYLAIGLTVEPGQPLGLREFGTMVTETRLLLRAIERDVLHRQPEIVWTVAGVEFLHGTGCRLILEAEGEAARDVAIEAQARSTASEVSG